MSRSRIRFCVVVIWAMIDCGNRATMPMKMMSEMPLPMPRSVICSPSHIMSMVPAVSTMIVLTMNPYPCTSSGTIGVPSTVRDCRRTVTPQACRAATATVP